MAKRWILWSGWLVSVMAVSAATARVEFNRDIRPILSENCFHCHGPAEEGRKADLRLDTAEGAYADHEGVRAIVPGDPEASETVYRIRTSDADELMPPPDSVYALTEKQKLLIEQWISEGAEYQGHWAFTPPAVAAQGTVHDLVDARIRQRLEPAGLQPAPPASPETLIRRLSLDLRGIPPTLAEVEAFVADPSPAAWEALVDRMLASPQCAERLALDWLDVARYADTNGYSIDDHRDMWVWRDWVIDAFLHNKPYDQFVTEQLAGDLIPDATPSQKMATGFLRNSMNTHEGGTIAEEYRVAYLADKVDTVSTAFMGLTMKCAQCHDHKYDPVSMRDYYRFYAFFDSATEHGKGATNGNTAPVIEVVSPLLDAGAVTAALQTRLQRIRTLREELLHRDAGAYEAWKNDVLAKAPPPATPAPLFRLPLEGEAEWIWSEASGDTKHLLLRKLVDIQEGLVSAVIRFTCDNRASLFVNGVKQGGVDPWMTPAQVDITKALKPGKNVIGADAENDAGVAGFIAWIQLTYPEGKTEYVLSDTTWEWRPHPSGKIKEAFAAGDGWRAPVSLGKHGVAPWNKLPGPTSSGPSLADLVRKPEGPRSKDEHKQVFDAYIKQAPNLTRRLAKSLSVEAGNIEKQLKKQGRTSVMIMDAPGKRATRMLMRGQYDQPGEQVTAGVPEVFPQLPSEVPADRLALAKWLVNGEHPLTARVAVNRYWQMLFGTGLVKTTEDFGSQGEWPSHPELLDTLALRFQESGWDVKQLLRELVLSETYRQGSNSTAHLREVDPYNRLLARAPRYRLPAELVRDNALAISGLLVQRIGGPSVYPEQPEGLWRQVSHFGYGTFTAQAYYPDVDEKAHRRSMYTFWKRTAPPPGMAVFDAPSRETCTARRLRTNTPLQALVLLNDPQYLRAARALAGRMIGEGGATPESRVAHAFRLATSRLPLAAEQALLTRSYARELSRFQNDPGAASALLGGTPDVERAAYTMVASTILNLNETITRQ